MVVARSDTVQPSLWDRFTNDLPGIAAELQVLRAQLADHLGPDADLDRILGGGLSGLRRQTDLDETSYDLAHQFLSREDDMQRIEKHGIVVTPQILREAVRRDIEMLFNVERLEAIYLLGEQEETRVVSPGEVLIDFPHVRSSVLNFGVPSFSGLHGAEVDAEALEKELRHVLQVFEPRLQRNSIQVRVKNTKSAGLEVDIDAILIMPGKTERMRLSTTIDESGRAETTRKAS